MGITSVLIKKTNATQAAAQLNLHGFLNRADIRTERIKSVLVEEEIGAWKNFDSLHNFFIIDCGFQNDGAETPVEIYTLENLYDKVILARFFKDFEPKYLYGKRNDSFWDTELSKEDFNEHIESLYQALKQLFEDFNYIKVKGFSEPDIYYSFY